MNLIVRRANSGISFTSFRNYHKFVPFLPKNERPDPKGFQVLRWQRLLYEKDNYQLSPETIFRRLRRRTWAKHKYEQTSKKRLIPELGPDLAAAHFILSLGGKVKFLEHESWVKADEKTGKFRLPTVFSNEVHIEAVDLSGTPVMYESFEMMENLDHLKFLDVSNCPNIDDWCLGRMHIFSKSLMLLNLSGCLKISERGLGALNELEELRRLYIAPPFKRMAEPELAAIMLQEMFGERCIVQGVDWQNVTRLNAYRDSNWEKLMLDEDTVEEIKSVNEKRSEETDNVDFIAPNDTVNLEYKRLSVEGEGFMLPLNAHSQIFGLDSQAQISGGTALSQNIARLAKNVDNLQTKR